MQIQPYLFFNGNCEEAIAFYCEALGATELMKMRFNEAPHDADRPIPPEMADKIMHATIDVEGTQLMMSDGGCMSKTDKFTGFGVSLGTTDVESAERCFNGLAQGGQITMPFQKTFWSPGFGMVTDRFGVPWMVTAQSQESAGA
jgi:PhnB protein